MWWTASPFLACQEKSSIPMITSYARVNTNLDTFCRILYLILHRKAKNSNHLQPERAGRHQPEVWSSFQLCLTQPQFYSMPVCQLDPRGQNTPGIPANLCSSVYAENRLEELTFPLAAHRVHNVHTWRNLMLIGELWEITIPPAFHAVLSQSSVDGFCMNHLCVGFVDCHVISLFIFI